MRAIRQRLPEGRREESQRAALFSVGARPGGTGAREDDPVSAAADWDLVDADLLDERRVAVPGFPLALLPSTWRCWVVDAARAADAPVDYVAQGVLAAVGGLSGGGVWVQVTAEWREPLILWLAVVGAPSTGKSPALMAVRRLLMRLEKEEREVEEAPSPIVIPARRFADLAALVGEQQRGTLLWRDGGLGCLAPVAGSRSARQFETFPMSILGSIEPDSAAHTLQRGEDGLAARFLYAWPHPSPFRSLADRAGSRAEPVLAALRRVRRSVGTLRSPRGLSLDAPATAAFDSFLSTLHADVQQAEGLEAAWLGKGRGTVARLAGVLALLEWSAAGQVADPPGEDDSLPRRIGRETLERAVSLWSAYYRPHARAFFQQAVPTDVECQARRTVRWLRAQGPASVSRRDVRRTALGQAVNAAEADRVLARLAQAGVLRPLEGEKRPQGGRPALRWSVNPALRAS